MQHQYRQERQMPMNTKPVLKKDNKIYRMQNPMRNELSLAILIIFKFHISSSVKKTAAAHPQTNIIFDKIGGSWWKPEYRIIIGGKNKKTVQAATEMLQKTLNGGKDKKEETVKK